MKNMGNFLSGLRNTVMGSPNYTDQLSNDESESDDFENKLAGEMETGIFQKRKIANLTIDAAPRVSVALPQPATAVNIKKLDEIEKELEEEEIVSLIYLLFDQNHYALQEIRLRLRDSSRRLLIEWANQEERRQLCWARKFIEALCIIQNYKILRTLGYNKQNVIDHYLPLQHNTSLHVNKMKKVCFLLCEQMDKRKTEKFIKMVNRDLNRKGFNFEDPNYTYLELYFLEWEIKNYITQTNVSNLKTVLKEMEEEELYNMIEDYMKFQQNQECYKTESDLQSNKALQKDNNPTRFHNEILQSSANFPSLENQSLPTHNLSTRMDNHTNVVRQRELIFDQEYIFTSLQSEIPSCIIPENGKYSINPNNPGVVLIINQQDFYTEFQEKYKHLLPPDTTEKLEPRTGTEKDRDYLQNTFKKFGFKVIIEDDLTHIELIAKIKEVLVNFTSESSLFICILSHGDKGIVYGSNSCRVKVSRIQKLMCKLNKTNLQEKPKILILQSCQGQQCQKINVSSSDEDDSSDSETGCLTTDGPNKQFLPKTVDMFTFWATVPGYAAVRHKKSGSWFIQAFCNQMETLGNRLHFADICTSVINDVTKKKWSTPEGDVNVTTPMVINTLRKSFFLPSVMNKEIGNSS